jgi:hypothetical protein
MGRTSVARRGDRTPTTNAAKATAATENPGLDDARDRCVAEINKYRATLRLVPLQRWREAEACTDGQAASDSQTKAAHGAFGQCNELAQCECPGWDSVDQTIVGCLKDMWDEGPGGGHHDAMADPDARYVACGFHSTGESDSGVWAIQNYGDPNKQALRRPSSIASRR